MIAELMPAGVAVVAMTTDVDAAQSPLSTAEEAVLGTHAVEKRRREFTTVRACARRAYRELGLPEAEVLSGSRGEPLWTAGVVGAMTHCSGYRACAMAPSSELLTIGIDAETHEPLPAGVLPEIAFGTERMMLRRLADSHPHVHWDRVLFSAKESVYKAWFPVSRRWLGFEDAALTIDPDGSFQAQLLVPGPIIEGQQLAGFSGRWVASDQLIGTAIALAVGAAHSDSPPLAAATRRRRVAGA